MAGQNEGICKASWGGGECKKLQGGREKLSVLNYLKKGGAVRKKKRTRS